MARIQYLKNKRTIANSDF